MNNKVKEQKAKWEKAVIGTTEYCFEDIPPETAVFLWLEIMETFGDAIGGFLKLSGKDAEDDDSINQAIRALTSSIKPKEIMAIIRQVLPSIFVNEKGQAGKRATFDDFQSKTLELYKVVFFAIRYNYADFFVEALSHLAKPSREGRDA
jgi:hypothetical protein